MVGDRRIHKRPFGLTNLPRLCGTISEEPKRGGKCAPAYVRPDWDDALKKKKTAKKTNETRTTAARGRSEREGRGRREHLRGYDSLEGKCCLPTCLQGCQLHDTHGCACAYAQRCQRVNGDTKQIYRV